MDQKITVPLDLLTLWSDLLELSLADYEKVVETHTQSPLLACLVLRSSSSRFFDSLCQQGQSSQWIWGSRFAGSPPTGTSERSLAVWSRGGTINRKWYFCPKKKSDCACLVGKASAPEGSGISNHFHCLVCMSGGEYSPEHWSIVVEYRGRMASIDVAQFWHEAL